MASCTSGAWWVIDLANGFTGFRRRSFATTRRSTRPSERRRSGLSTVVIRRPCAATAQARHAYWLSTTNCLIGTNSWWRFATAWSKLRITTSSSTTVAIVSWSLPQATGCGFGFFIALWHRCTCMAMASWASNVFKKKLGLKYYGPFQVLAQSATSRTSCNYQPVPSYTMSFTLAYSRSSSTTLRKALASSPLCAMARHASSQRWSP
jgi:hypothetical protein